MLLQLLCKVHYLQHKKRVEWVDLVDVSLCVCVCMLLSLPNEVHFLHHKKWVQSFKSVHVCCAQVLHRRLAHGSSTGGHLHKAGGK